MFALVLVSRSVVSTMVPMLTTSVLALAESVPRARAIWFSNSLFAAHEDLLHFLGGLIFVVFAQIAIAAGDGDFLGIGGNVFLHQLGVFVSAPFQAFPGNQQGSFLLRLLAGNHAFARRDELLTIRASKRTFVHVVKTRRKLQGAGQVLDDFQCPR